MSHQRFRKVSSILACAVALAMVPVVSSAQTPAPAAGGQTRAAGESDRAFIEKAAAGGAAEVEFGKLAQKKAANAEVKRFGQQMVEDHTAANRELAKITGMQPTGLTGVHEANAKRLAGLDGARFDQEYMTLMVSDHQKTVAEFRQASESATDPDIKRFAGKTLPKLEEHLKMAQRIHGSLGSASGGARPGGGTGSMGSSSDGVRRPGDPGMMPPEKTDAMPRAPIPGSGSMNR